MDNQNTVITVIKNKNLDKLAVYHACSLEDEIRFYLNETQYISAIEKGEEDIIVGLMEETDAKKEKQKLKLKKADYFKLFAIFFVMVIVIGAITIASLLIGAYFNSMFMYLVTLNIMMFLFDIIRLLIMEAKTTPPCLKSKHSAEHMMVNFLEKNRRLPKSIKEVRTVSRFCIGCGSEKLIKGITEEFISKMFATLIAAISSIIYLGFMNNEIIGCIIFICVYLGVIILIQLLLKKWNKLNFLIRPVKKALTIIAQYSNTTKKVEENDIYMAYLAAKEWIKLVYPEYYDKTEDTFQDSLFA